MRYRAGKYRNNLSGDAAYQSFVPNPLPPDPPIEMKDDLVKQLISANKSISTLDAIAKRIPNMDLFISMYVRKEALMSSQIEGTQATLEDVLDPLIAKNTNRDVADVINYINATNYAIDRLKTIPLCNRLIRETHAVLMEGVRGEYKSPGEFRRSQNWIGAQGSTIKNARHIPPNLKDMHEALSDLELYMHEDATDDPLVQAALIHYQFETIHPFLDGNGRIGRLLNTLFLMEKKVLTAPALYISYFLKKNRIEYYDRLMEVRTKGNFEQWVIFFLMAIEESALDAVDTIDQLIALQTKNESIIRDMGRATENVIHIFRYLESNPIIDIGQTAKHLGVAYNTVSRAVDRLIEVGILVQSTDSQRNRTFSYDAYLDVLKKGT